MVRRWILVFGLLGGLLATHGLVPSMQMSASAMATHGAASVTESVGGMAIGTCTDDAMPPPLAINLNTTGELL